MNTELPPIAFDSRWAEVGRFIYGLPGDPRKRVIIDVLEALTARQDAYSVYMAECVKRCTKPVKGPPAGRSWRRTAPARKGWVERTDTEASEDSYALAAHLFWRSVQWHSGSTGGSLWGPMGDSFSYGDHWERASTAAQVLMIATGQSMAAVAAWTRAIYGT